LHRTIGRATVTAVAVVGGLLAVSLTTGVGPVTAAPCAEKYPAGATTTARLAVEDPFAVAGQHTQAIAHVTRGEPNGETPVGRVRVTVLDGDGDRHASRTKVLREGTATITLPRGLPARETYTVRAQYLPPRCSVLTPAPPAQAHYTVYPAGAAARGR